MSDMKFYVYQFIDNKDQNKAITTIWLENYAEMLHLIQIDNEWFGVIPSGSVHICTYGQTALDMQEQTMKTKIYTHLAMLVKSRLSYLID